MGFGISWPTNTTDIIDEIRYTIGRDILINVRVSGTACPDCSLDPVTNLSTDPFCATCAGEYWLNTISGVTCSAHVRWKSTDQPLRVAGGIIDEGDCYVTIALSGHLGCVQSSVSYVVDDKLMYMKNYKVRGVPQPNRITVVLLEDKG